MNDVSRSSIKLTHHFISEQGQGVLDRLGEKPIVNAEWHISSHGGVIRVEGEHDALFERLLVVLPRPPEAPAERFREWAEGRIEHYGWYLQLTNTGKCVQTLFHDVGAIVIIMRRLGRSTADPQFTLPASNEIIGILGKFVRDLGRYVEYLRDNDLRYVRAMRVYEVPRVSGTPEWLIGLDILPTLIGIDGPSNAIHPLTLARGIIGEFAELFDQVREQAANNVDEGGFRKARKRAAELDALESVVNGLDGICAKIDLQKPALGAVHEWLLEAADPPVPSRKGSWISSLILIAGCIALAWHLAR